MEESSVKQDEKGSENAEINNDLCTLCMQEKCVEPRIYKNSLDFEFKGQETNVIDKWHEARQEELRNELPSLAKKYLNKNFARLGLAITYEYKSEIKITKFTILKKYFPVALLLKIKTY